MDGRLIGCRVKQNPSVFAAPHKRLFATFDETSPSAPALPADAVTNRGLALREKQLLAWKTTFTVNRQQCASPLSPSSRACPCARSSRRRLHRFIRGVGVSEGLHFKWSRPNFISHNQWSIVLYHESNRGTAPVHSRTDIQRGLMDMCVCVSCALILTLGVFSARRRALADERL
jgi:hypothetical protein